MDELLNMQRRGIKPYNGTLQPISCQQLYGRYVTFANNMNIEVQIDSIMDPILDINKMVDDIKHNLHCECYNQQQQNY